MLSKRGNKRIYNIFDLIYYSCISVITLNHPCYQHKIISPGFSITSDNISKLKLLLQWLSSSEHQGRNQHCLRKIVLWTCNQKTPKLDIYLSKSSNVWIEKVIVPYTSKSKFFISLTNEPIRWKNHLEVLNLLMCHDNHDLCQNLCTDNFNCSFLIKKKSLLHSQVTNWDNGKNEETVTKQKE